MYRNSERNKKLARVVALILAFSMLLMAAVYMFAMTGWFGADLERNGFVARAATEQDSGELDPQTVLSYNRLMSMQELLVYITTLYKDKVDVNALVDGAYKGMFEALGDPWSVYYPKAATATNFVETIEGEYGGIGVTMLVNENGCIITNLNERGPAYAAGVHVGDYIVSVDGTAVKGLSVDKIAEMVRGKQGTVVSVIFSRNGILTTYKLTRAKLKIDSVTYELLEGNIGYIDIDTFSSSTSDEFRCARLTLLNEGINSMIIDLRDNGGGIMDAALHIADQLMPEGVITYYQQQGDIIETVRSKANQTRSVPIVVLTNENTASASECLVGALKDSGTAVIVGTNTYGKGVAQTISTLKHGDAIKMSIFYFLTPNMTPINGVGIAPTYTVYNGAGYSDDEVKEIEDGLVAMTEGKKYKAGEMGLNVFAAQQRLKLLKYDVKETGVMDEKTVAAVKKFQSDVGGYPYGGLDFSTIEAIKNTFSTFLYGNEDLQLKKAIELLK